MKKTHKTKSITCRIVSTGTVMQVNTIDEILSPGQYKIDACGVTASDGFPDGVDGECLSAYLEVSDTNHSADNLKSAAVGQTLTYTDADGDTAVYHRSGTNKDGKVEWSAWSDTAALGLQDGSITAEKLSSDIRTKVESPLRPLFIAAGAEYNDTGADITKTAPWGESVTHKAGHYYLNGLGDITEEQMMAIYNAGFANGASMASLYEGYTRLRTCLQRNPRYNYPRAIGGYSAIDMNQSFQLCSAIETINITGATIYVKTAIGAFQQCEKLVRIHDILNLGAISKTGLQGIFATCLSLESIRIKAIKVDISFSNSPSLNKESLVYIIQNAAPTVAMAITLHTDAYARLADDADVVAALETQPLVSLVCA